LYANVIVDAHGVGGTFTYGIPTDIEGAVKPGICVAVSFSNREHVGYVLSLTDVPPEVSKLKYISGVIPDAQRLPGELLSLACFLSDYYIVPLPQAVRAMVPEAMSGSVATVVRLLDAGKASPGSPKQLKVVEALSDLGGEADLDLLRKKAKTDDFGVALRQLRQRKAVEVVRTLDLPKARPKIVQGVRPTFTSAEVNPARAPKQARILEELLETGEVRQAELLRKTQSSSSPLRSLLAKGLAEKTAIRLQRRPFGNYQQTKPCLRLTEEQEQALALIENTPSERPRIVLVHGVTASGKTEIYLHSIESVLRQRRTALILVPEVALTTHMLERYASRLGDQVAVLHSRLSFGERYDECKRIENGEASVVIGPRSAVFAPLSNLGLVVIDEEHEPSFKQENTPRYDARKLAEERAVREGASVILGSATPSVESYYRAVSGDIALATLTRRVDNRPMPTVRIIDQRVEFEQGRRYVLSEPLRDGIAERLKRREQVLLFINRRGYASFLLCRSCGYVPKCPNCDVAYTYHLGPRTLRCHHCNTITRAPGTCPNCGDARIRQFGIGTQKVEEEVRQVFPDARPLRMDHDTTLRKGTYASILKAFHEGEANILVGTQMIAKGFDFPNVTLVGVINADTALHIPDFRSSERTFQILAQVSGRAGRGESPGEVIIQTFSPDHYAITAASNHDYLGFYNREIEHRRELSYPPFSRLVNVISSDPIDGTAEGRIQTFASEFLRRLEQSGAELQDFIDVLGPAPAPQAKLKGLYRWHMCIRDRGSSGLHGLLRDVLSSLPHSVAGGIVLDVDPVTML